MKEGEVFWHVWGREISIQQGWPTWAVPVWYIQSNQQSFGRHMAGIDRHAMKEIWWCRQWGNILLRGNTTTNYWLEKAGNGSEWERKRELQATPAVMQQIFSRRSYNRQLYLVGKQSLGAEHHPSQNTVSQQLDCMALSCFLSWLDL